MHGVAMHGVAMHGVAMHGARDARWFATNHVAAPVNQFHQLLFYVHANRIGTIRSVFRNLKPAVAKDQLGRPKPSCD